MAKARKASRNSVSAAERARVRFTNSQIFMTHGDPAKMLPTADKYDVAHNVKGVDGLRPAAVRVNGKAVVAVPEGVATPRHYPAALMQMRPDGTMVSFESGFEDTAARERWLCDMGLIEAPVPFASHTERAVAYMQGSIGNSLARDRLRGIGH